MMKRFLTIVLTIVIFSGIFATAELKAEESTKTIQDSELQMVTYSILNTDTPIDLNGSTPVPAKTAPVPQTKPVKNVIPPTATPAPTATKPSTSAPATVVPKTNVQNVPSTQTKGTKVRLLTKPKTLNTISKSSKSDSVGTMDLPDELPVPELLDTGEEQPIKTNDKAVTVQNVPTANTTVVATKEQVTTSSDQPAELDFSKVINSTDKFTFDPFAEQANKNKNPALHDIEISPLTYEGLTPGVSTIQDVMTKWGRPKNTMKQAKYQIFQYLSAKADSDIVTEVQIVFKANIVTTILARFREPKSVDWIEKNLGVSGVRPVTVTKPDGTVLGLAYPERGASVAYTGTKDSKLVERVILEPIELQPFTLRAEATLDADPEFAKADLEYAMKLQPQNADVHWLMGRCLMNLGESQKAVSELEKAVALDRNQPRYNLSLAQAQASVGMIEQAEQTADKTIELADNQENPRPHLSASAWCLKGDLATSIRLPDYKKALDYHSKAIVLAQGALETSKIPTVRLEAYQTLVSAHLGAAHDIAWGTWNQKASAVVRWLLQANKYNEKLIKNASYTDMQTYTAKFNLAKRALSACAGLGKDVNPTIWVEMLIANGDKLIQQYNSPEEKENLLWDMGMAIYDAVQIFQARGESDLAMKYGRKAIECMEAVNRAGVQMDKFTVDDLYIQGRLYFRLGAIAAITEENHQIAVSWYQKALPIFEAVVDGIPRAELGRLGETLVSMGVSYWEIGKKNQAVNLTENGLYCLEQAAEDGLTSANSLEIPYRNLSLMLKNIGNEELSMKYLQKADAAKAIKR